MLVKRLQKGYTLIEILIVMAIISIVGGIAILTISYNQNSRQKNLANQLVSLLMLAEEQAMLQPNILALGFTQTTFQFYQYQNVSGNHWQALPPASTLGQHSIPSGIEITLKIANKIIPPATNTTRLQPQLIISTSGDIIPFTLLIAKKGEHPRFQVVGEANGNITSSAVSE
jgi:prepilin-type N-terminal cleavage/methylation domain-containing protein